MSLFSADAKQDILSQHSRALLNGYRPEASFRRLFNSPDSPERLEHLLYLDSKTYLPGDILAKVDRMSMAHSVEARSPLLDHKLIEFAGTLPSAFKVRHGVTKYILKQAVERLIPAEITHRPKHGFSVPLEKWMRKELQPMLNDLLLDRTARARGFLDQAGVAEVMAEHQRGRRDHSQQLWALLSLEVWFRTFIDRAPNRSFAGDKEAALSGV
jgi:asparagine synthase (glutamine-hydrolysing)